MEMFTWDYLATVGGAAAAVAMITEFLKVIPITQKIPSQALSYIVALVIMFPASFFTGNLTVNAASLIPLNALVVMLTANGAYNTLTGSKKKELN